MASSEKYGKFVHEAKEKECDAQNKGVWEVVDLAGKGVQTPWHHTKQALACRERSACIHRDHKLSLPVVQSNNRYVNSDRCK